MSPIVLPALILVALCVIGLEYCFRGERNLRIFAALYGFWLGYSWVLRSYDTAGGNVWVYAVIAGIVLAVLAFFIIKAAIFLAGGLLGLTVYYVVLFASPGIVGGGSWTAALICFVGFGLLAIFIRKPVLIIATACYGAYTFVDTLGILIGVLAAGAVPAGTELSDVTTTLAPMSIFHQTSAVVPWIGTAALTVAGIVQQFRGKRARR